MLVPALREQVLHANQEIARRGLAPHTFGNASGIDRSGDRPLVVIKPSGVDYATIQKVPCVLRPSYVAVVFQSKFVDSLR